MPGKIFFANPKASHTIVSNIHRVPKSLDLPISEIPQKEGITPGDKTAPVPGHEDWGSDRANRPSVLFMLYPTKDFCQRVCKSDRLSLGSHRVIDRHGRWMKHWDDVPVTLSSLIPGWYLEALIRRNPDLTIYDIRARFMDSFLVYDHKKNKLITQSAWGSTTVTNRMMRFRDETFNLTCKWHLRLVLSMFSALNSTELNIPSKFQDNARVHFLLQPVLTSHYRGACQG